MSSVGQMALLFGLPVSYPRSVRRRLGSEAELELAIGRLWLGRRLA